MKRYLLIAIFLTFGLVSIVSAHSGRTDSSGGHNDRSNGTYHYHNTGSSSSSSSVLDRLYNSYGGNSNAYIKSRINGSFNGFGYGNKYILTNGQTWIQVDRKKATVKKYRPKVTIFNDHMRVEGLMHAVRVRQY